MTTDRLDLDLDAIEEAARSIPALFSGTPQFEDTALNAALGRRVTVKVETLNPLRSFKGRGVSYALRAVEAGTPVACASSGNFGQAVAYVGRERGLPVHVFTPDGVNPGKRTRMEAFGATVVPAGPDSASIRVAAREHAAAHPGTVLLEDGVQPAIAEGAGTIGVELLRTGPYDAVVLPIGDGALVTGVGCWLRAHAPDTRIVGVNAAGAPAMARSVAAGRPVTLDRVDTVADGIDVVAPHAESLRRVAALVDEIVLVPDDALVDATVLLAGTLGVVPEPAGAAATAAIAQGLVGGERLAAVVTGANVRPDVLRTVAARLATG